MRVLGQEHQLQKKLLWPQRERYFRGEGGCGRSESDPLQAKVAVAAARAYSGRDVELAVGSPGCCGRSESAVRSEKLLWPQRES